MQLTDVDSIRRQVLQGIAGAGLIGWVSPVIGADLTTMQGAHSFDFLFGRWLVKHRKLKKRLVGSNEWLTFDGTLDVKPVLGGAGNIDENVLHDPAGTYLACSIRIFDPKTELWSIYWSDARFAGLDKPVIGRFEGSRGHFYNEDVFEGRPIKVRFTYEALSANNGRWSQAFSVDRGVTWETNWVMDFTRETRA